MRSLDQASAALLRRGKQIVKNAPLLREILRERDRLARELGEANARVERTANELGEANAKIEAVTGELERATGELARAKGEIEELRRRLPGEGEHPAFAHWGEDQIVGWLFEGKAPGTYVDVGAYHPNVASNTRLLFDRGWSGINIDCNPTMIDFFRQLRPGDVNLNVAVGAEEKRVKYFFFHPWASSNTISAEFAKTIAEGQNIKVEREIEIPCVPLRKLLSEHLAAGRSVDFLNVDVEAVDLEVLESNDWERFRPLVVAVEEIDFSIGAADSSPTYRFLRARGYRAVSRAIFTNVFVDEARRAQLNGCS